jgi:H+/Cl- antiporter ClcA
MLLVSLVTITAGVSAGPEASVVILGGGLVQLLDRFLLHQPLRERRILSLTGMSAALGGFFGMPLTSAIFVLEIPHHNGIEYYEAISPSVVGSVVSGMMNKFISRKPLGGHVLYAGFQEPLGPTSMGWSVLLGILAGLTALVFIALMRGAKWMAEKTKLIRFPLLCCVLGSVLVGVFAIISPSSLFWSENELQFAVSMGNATLPYAKSPGVIWFQQPMLPWQLALSGVVKLFAIVMTVAAGFPGGIIFPLLFAGTFLGNAWGSILGVQSTVSATCFMAALMASILRTPWSAVLIVLLTDVGSPRFMEVFPLTVCSVMIAMVMVYYSRLFGKEQHGRRDLIPAPAVHDGLFQTAEDEEDANEDKAEFGGKVFDLTFGDSVISGEGESKEEGQPLVPAGINNDVF